MPAIEITTRIGCRIACAYCPQDLLSAAYSERSREFLMEFGLFQECLKKIPAEVNIHFSGMCEPWLNPECTRMVLHAHETGHKVIVYTSAVGMGPADVAAMRGIPFPSFVVHLPSSEGMERITVDDRYLSTLHCLGENGIVTSWLCHGTGVNPLIKPVIPEKIDYVQLSTRAGNVKIKDRELPGKRTGHILCKRSLSQNVLLPNGDVLLCCMDYGMKHVIGNLRDQDYESLFSSREFLLVKRGLDHASLDTLCRTCDYFAQEVSLFDRLRRMISFNPS